MKTFLKILYNILTCPLRMVKKLRELNNLIYSDRNKPKAPVINNRHLWDKICRRIVLTSIKNPDFSRYFQVLKAFYSDEITCLRDFGSAVPENEIVLLVAVKNDCSRIEPILSHYRKIGVKHFVFLDNGSDDGTIDEVLSQKDTACYRTNEPFNSFFKAGWLSRLAAHYGINRWYIVIDSDELLVYPQMNRISIKDYLKAALEKGYHCIKTFMLDVYPDGALMDETKSDEEYMALCKYIDRADKPDMSGCCKYNTASNTVTGGMRERLFFEDTGVLLTRTTLLYLPYVFLLGPHSIYPKIANKTAPHAAALLHYKFLPSDKQRYRRIEKDGNYYKNSLMYRKINNKMAEKAEINAMSDLSIEFSAENFHMYFPFLENLAAQ